MTCSCITRRRALGLAALTAIASTGLLSACSESTHTGASWSPIDIDRSTTCSLDGMLLADYPGPKAQIHYADQAKPTFFCDTVELFNTLLTEEQVRPMRAIYVQDMGQAQWEAPQGHWIDAKTAHFIVGSRLHGSMGPTIASFSQASAAETMRQTHGGKLLRFADITRDMVDLSGGALHDQRM